MDRSKTPAGAMTAPPETRPLPSRCWAEIRLDRLVKNVATVRESVGAEVQVISVVKANGYGLGATPLARALDAGGVKFFGVANCDEAAALRTALPECAILLLSATLPGEDEFAAREGFIPTLSSEEEIERFETVAKRLGGPVAVHLKIDTGMGRLGKWHEEAGGFLRRANESRGLKVEGVYTHFASGAEEPAFTGLQRTRFAAALQTLEPLPAKILIHADNSGGTESFPGPPYNAIRLGLLQLGYPASPSSRFDVRPVASIHSIVTTVKSMPKGASISYCRTHRLSRPARIAVVAAGYADGIPRACGNRGAVLIGGCRCPILGHVTMDETIVDVTEAGKVRAGDQVTFFGERDGATISLEEFSSWAGSIPWESLCRISPRVKRVYVN